MNYINLFIKTPVEAELDLSQEMDIALQYSIADIKDITKRNTSYSKTIILPGTKNNNYWFGNLFDINSDFTMYNPNKKVDARILVNTETVIEGFLQLKKIKKLVNADAQGNMIQYEVVVFNNAIDLMTELGEKTLNELDLSRFNHEYSNTNVKNSWDNTYKEGYVYPMYGTEDKDSSYKVTYFYPATFYRTVLDEMITSAGFGWRGSLKTNAQFNKEIIPYVSDGRPKLDETEIDRRLFYVGITASTPDTNISTYMNSFTPNSGSSLGIVSLTNETAPYFDNDNHWNTTIWTADTNGNYSFNLNLSYDLGLRNTSGSTTMALVGTLYPLVKTIFYYQYSTDNGATWITWDNTTSETKQYNTTTIAPGVSLTQSFFVNKNSLPIDFNIGTKVRISTRVYNTNGGWWAGTGGNATPNMTAKIKLKGDSWLRNTAYATQVSEGDTIKLNQFLSEKIKQKDILTDLIKRYNLYIQTDPNNPRVLIFDTRPDFYSTGTTLDWTNKKDYSSEDQIELLSELQFKKMIFTYKSDSDVYNKNYTDATGDIYGQYKYTFDNDFVKGEEKVETPFSPTPLVKTAFGAFVPCINPENPKVAPRILYWGGLKDYGSDWSWTYQNVSTGLSGLTETFTTYPYAGHLDDPIAPTIDINFGVCKYYWYDELLNTTQNNMYNTYWSNYIKQIEEGRMVTSKFYLDEGDIKFIKDNFNTKIFILDSYYYVNKIIDYKPLNNSVTTVELIKTTQGVQWKPIRKIPVIKKPITIKTDVKSPGISVGVGNVGGTGNVVVGSNNILGGTTIKDGTTRQNTSLVVGNNNSVVADNTIVTGDKNIVVSDKSLVIGDNNNVTGDNVIVFGDNVTTSESNVMIVSQTMLVTSNYISASRDEVLNPFPDNKIINYLSGSRNVIREIGSQDITNYVSGGRFTI